MFISFFANAQQLTISLRVDVWNASLLLLVQSLGV